MKLIYKNFDTLDISFQGSFPKYILEQISHGKEQAQNEKSEIPLSIGKNQIKAMIAETGAKGGFRYRFDTGLDGETWFIAHSSNSDNWNIRLSVKSLALSLYGYEGVKQRIIDKLIKFEAMGKARYSDNDLDIIFLPHERISRFDYCFDFIMPKDFEPSPKNFIAHQRSKKHVYGEEGKIGNYTALNGDKINTIRIGEMPNRQAIIYNKTKELISSQKSYMWDIWDIDKENFDHDKFQIWRIEVRAGKNELDKWGLKRFDDFESKAGDIISDILKTIRYTIPVKEDANRSRWDMHPIWEKALETSYKALAPYSTNAIRENIIKDYRQNVIKGYKERVIGNLIGLTASQGRDISDMPISISEIEQTISNLPEKDKNILTTKFQKAEERFRFLK